MARRKSTTTSTNTGGKKKTKTTTANANETEATAQPSHRTADQPKGVLRSNTTTANLQPVTNQTTTDSRREVQLLPREFDALIGLRRLQSGLDSHVTRQRELARLEIVDPVAHYYAQTLEERAPGYQLQAAAVLFEMSGGDVVEPVAALTLIKLGREEKERARLRDGRALMAGFKRAAKAKKETEEAVEMVGGEGEEAGGEPPKRKKRQSVRFGGKE